MRAWLDTPLSRVDSAASIVVATLVVVAMTRWFHGVTFEDGSLSLGPALSVAHGDLACMYPHASATTPAVAPVFPLIAALYAALAHLGAGVGFPSSVHLGPECARAFTSWTSWIARTHVASHLVLVGYLGGVVLLGGSWWFLRTTSLARTRWESAAILVVALSPTVAMTLTQYFHPEDLLALGVALAALAAWRHDRAAIAGVLFALAVLTQQFTLLIMIPVIVTGATSRSVGRLALGAFATLALILTPLGVATSGRVFGALSGAAASSHARSTWLAAVHANAVELYVVARLLPLASAFALALWIRRRHPSQVNDAATTMALIAVCLSARLVVEVSLFGYYFMALGVTLVLARALQRRVSVTTIIWLIALGVIYDPFPYPHELVASFLPSWYAQLVFGVSGLVLAADALRRSLRTDSVGPQRGQNLPLGASRDT